MSKEDIPTEPLAFRPPEWTKEALCTQVGWDIFFPPDDKPVSRDFYRQAKKVCDNCLVSKECLDFALENNEAYGIWGGTTPQERLAMKKKLKNR